MILAVVFVLGKRPYQFFTIEARTSPKRPLSVQVRRLAHLSQPLGEFFAVPGVQERQHEQDDAQTDE